MVASEVTPEDFLEPGRFRALYDCALPVVYGYLLRRCGGPEQAADLTQETFLSAVRALHAGTVVEAPIPWLVSIARARLVDHYRRAEVRSRIRPIPRAIEMGSPATTRAEVTLVSALQSIPDHYRLALVLRYVDDLPLDEVATHLGKSAAATESLLARARRRLAESYEELNDE